MGLAHSQVRPKQQGVVAQTAMPATTTQLQRTMTIHAPTFSKGIAIAMETSLMPQASVVAIVKRMLMPTASVTTKTTASGLTMSVESATGTIQAARAA
jgi:hypothetical protein